MEHAVNWLNLEEVSEDLGSMVDNLPAHEKLIYKQLYDKEYPAFFVKQDFRKKVKPHYATPFEASEVLNFQKL